MLSEIRQRYGRVLVVGHSQGAILAYGIAARAGQLVDEAIGVSGWLPPGAFLPGPVSWPRVTVVHGTADQTIPVDLALDSAQLMKFGGAVVTVDVRDGKGHNLESLWPVVRDDVLAWRAAA
jgi:predicted esterase